MNYFKMLIRALGGNLKETIYRAIDTAILLAKVRVDEEIDKVEDPKVVAHKVLDDLGAALKAKI